MKNECKILYYYFLKPDGKIAKIPRKEDEHRQKLLDNTRKIFPAFMHPYAFGMMRDDEAEASKATIDIFQNHRTSLWFRIKRIFRK